MENRQFQEAGTAAGGTPESRVLLFCLACGGGCGLAGAPACPGPVPLPAGKDEEEALEAIVREAPDAVVVHAPDLNPEVRALLGRFIPACPDSTAVVAAFNRCTDADVLAALGMGVEEVVTGDAAGFSSSLKRALARKAGEKKRERNRRLSEQRIQDLESYLEATRAVLAAENVVQALSGLYHALKKKIGARSGYVAVLTPDGQANDLVVMDVPEAEEGTWSCIPVFRWQRKAFQSRRLVLRERPDLGPEGLPDWHRSLGNVCLSPVMAEDRPEGMLVLAGKDGAYTPRDLDAVEIFSGLAARALRNARDREDLHRARQEWENIFQAIGQSAMILSPDYEILDANPSTAKLLGEKQEKLLGRKCWEMFHDTDGPPPECAMARLHEKGFTGTVTTESTTSGGVLLVSATPILDPEGRVEKIIHIATDISSQRRMQDELAKSKRQFEELFESMSSGVAIFEPSEGGREFILRDLNRAAEKIARVKRREVIGKPAEEAFPGLAATGLLHIFADVVNSGRKDFLPRTHYQDGRVSFWVENHVYPVNDGRIVSVFDDVTEKVRAEQQKAMLEVQLRQQQKMEAIGLLAGGVAHEINNPVHGIMSYARLILEDGGDAARRDEYASEIMNETKRITSIVNNLMIFARHEEQGHSPAWVPDMVESTLKLIGSALRRDRIHVDLRVEPDLPTIRCRSQQIQQVILNLLTNARDALNERYPGYHPRKKMEVRAGLLGTAEPATVRISVTDYGTGIESALEERIFEPFFTTKPKEIGTGLGLAISHGIIRDHNGSISLESRYGQFTTFHVDLPADMGRGAVSPAPGE